MQKYKNWVIVRTLTDLILLSKLILLIDFNQQDIKNCMCMITSQSRYKDRLITLNTIKMHAQRVQSFKYLNTYINPIHCINLNGSKICKPIGVWHWNAGTVCISYTCVYDNEGVTNVIMQIFCTPQKRFWPSHFIDSFYLLSSICRRRGDERKCQKVKHRLTRTTKK